MSRGNNDCPAPNRWTGTGDRRRAFWTPIRDPETCPVNGRTIALEIVLGNGGLHNVPTAEDAGRVVHPSVHYGVISADQKAGYLSSRLPVAVVGLDYGHDECACSTCPVALAGRREVDVHLAVIEAGTGYEITAREIEAGIDGYGRIRLRRGLLGSRPKGEDRGSRYRTHDQNRGRNDDSRAYPHGRGSPSINRATRPRSVSSRA